MLHAWFLWIGLGQRESISSLLHNEWHLSWDMYRYQADLLAAMTGSFFLGPGFLGYLGEEDQGYFSLGFS